MSQVEFRCMIQDIVGNDIYQTEEGKLQDRTVFYCVTIPGENDWVSAREENNLVSKIPEPGGHLSSTTNGDSPSVASKAKERLDKLSQTLVTWSYPILAAGENRSCLIQIYDPSLAEHLRVNDIVLVKGLVEKDELVEAMETTTTTTNGGGSENHDPEAGAEQQVAGDPAAAAAAEEDDELDFEPKDDFPGHLVPRVRVLSLQKLKHLNPMVSQGLSRDNLDRARIKQAHAKLLSIFTKLFGGDALCAKYLVFLLIARIQHKSAADVVGKYTLNISGIKPSMGFLIDKIREIISKITTHSHLLDLSLANLNNLRFRPKKDYDNNKMIAGLLQLPDGMFLILNETALSEGQLTTLGKENMQALKQLIEQQRLSYDYKFHLAEVDTDLQVLVFSEGKSLLSTYFHVKLENNDPKHIAAMREACDEVDQILTDDVLNMLRYYTTAMRQVSYYDVKEETSAKIQSDYCKWRRESDPTNLFSPRDLSCHLTLANYLTLSRGEQTLTNELWNEACRLETARKSRLIPCQSK